MDPVSGEDAEEAGDDGKAWLVVRQKRARKCQCACGEVCKVSYRHAVIQGLQEVCDAVRRLG